MNYEDLLELLYVEIYVNRSRNNLTLTVKYLQVVKEYPIMIKNDNDLTFFVDMQLEELTRYLPLHVSLVNGPLVSVSSSNYINTESSNTQREPILNQVGVNLTNEVRGFVELVAPNYT